MQHDSALNKALAGAASSCKVMDAWSGSHCIMDSWSQYTRMGWPYNPQQSTLERAFIRGYRVE